MKNKWINMVISMVLVLSMMISAFSGCNNETPLPEKESSMIESIVATENTEDGVSERSAFQILLNTKTTEDVLRENIFTEPNIGEFSLTGSEKNWVLTPEKPLNKNKVYSFGWLSANKGTILSSFAFQTENELKVNTTYPRDNYKHFPLYGAIEVIFNTYVVSPNEHFSIEPTVEGELSLNGYSLNFLPATSWEKDTTYKVTIKKGLASVAGSKLEEDYSFSFHTSENEEDFGGINFSEGYATNHLLGDTIKFALSTSITDYELPKFYTEDDLKVFDAGEETEVTEEIIEDTEAVGIRDEADVLVDLSENPITSYDTNIAAELPTSNVEIYKFQNISDYSNEIIKHMNEESSVDSTKLSLITSYEAELVKERYQDYVYLPESLEVGQYLIKVSVDYQGESYTTEKLFAVSDYNIYTQWGNGELLVWVNNSTTGEQVENAEVSFEEFNDPYFENKKTESELVVSSGLTQGNGVLTLETKSAERGYISISLNGSGIYFKEENTYYSNSSNEDSKYYSAMYIDKGIYKPTDKINYWGFIKPRKDDTTIPEELTVSLTIGGAPISEKIKVVPNIYGSFSGSIDISQYRTGYYSLSLNSTEATYFYEKGFVVEDYVKPEYSISLKSDKDVYRLGESVSYTAIAKSFDGTPVRNKELYINYEDNAQTVMTDEKGTAKASFIVKNRSTGTGVTSWQPMMTYSFVNNASDDEIFRGSSAYVYVMPSLYALDLKTDLEKGTIDIKTAIIDEEKITEASTPIWPRTEESYYDSVKGESADIPITVKILKYTLEKTLISESYDSVNKKKLQYYDYNYVETTNEVIQTETTNGKLLLNTDKYESTDEYYYKVSVEYDGGLGAEITANDDRWDIVYDYVKGTEYRFFSSDEVKAKIGEPVQLDIYINKKKAENKGLALYTAYQTGLMEVNTFSVGSGTSFSMKEEHLPNVMVAGAYFDGRYIHVVRSEAVNYDYSQKELELAVKTDKDTYYIEANPDLSIKLTDKAGNPVKGEVVVSIVDEAVFDLQEQEIDILSDIYRNSYYYYMSQNTSIVAMDTDAGEEKLYADTMGGNPEAGAESAPATMRNEFKDSAYFGTVETDENGEAKLDIKLPHNITSWRISAFAITEDISGATEIKNVVVTQPLYINTIFTQNYLEGDDVTIALDVSGEKVTLGDSVDYKVELKQGDKIVETKSDIVNVGDRAYVNLGKLPIGDYLVLVSGESSGNNDLLQKDISVVSSKLTVPHSEPVEFEQIKNIASERYPVDLLVYNREQVPYFDSLKWVSSQYGDRTETNLAKYLAEKIMKDTMGSSYVADSPLPKTLDNAYMNIDQGYLALPAGESDVATTAKVVATASIDILGTLPTTYFYNILQSSESNNSDKVMALVGLAYSKEPVLLTIESNLKGELLTDSEKLYLGAGLSALGDYNGAKAVFETFRDNIKLDKKGKYLDMGTRTENDEATAAAILLLSKVNNSEAGAFATYLMNTEKDSNQRVPYELEILSYLQNFNMLYKNLPISYTLSNGEKVEKELNIDNSVITIPLAKEDISAFDIEQKSKLSFIAIYEDSVSDLEAKLSATIKKDYVKDKKYSNIESMMKVNFDITLDDSCGSGVYTLYDGIPSGMRYYRDAGNDENKFYQQTEENQRLATAFYYDKSEDKGKISGFYYVNGTLPGEYVVTESVLLSPNKEVIALGEADKIVVK